MRHTKYDIRNTKSESPVTNHESRVRAGSALILTVVLTTLLAAVGVVFVMMARVDKIATSAISENRELNFAVETVIAKISQELALDVPHKPDCCPGQEYYDYPDPCNAWLASLEPDVERHETDPTKDIYYWRQISDVTGYLAWRTFATRYVKVDPQPGRGLPFNQDYIREYPPIKLDAVGELDLGELDDGMLGGEPRGQLADADGDGIADAKWIPLYNITTSKGKTIYAAIRIVDNAAMLNVNTACKFDPCEVPLFRERIDGSSQMQINLAGLARLGDDVDTIHTARCDTSDDPNDPNNRNNWNTFQNKMLWRIESPAGGYLPFDISDELELRYRYCITSRAQTRLESLWNNTIGLSTPGLKNEPYGGGAGTLEDWQKAVTDPYDPNNYRRHLLTTYNIDRIIAPDCRKMININDETTLVVELYRSLQSSIDPTIADPNIRRRIERRFAQLAVNIIDFADKDDDNPDDGFLDSDSVTTFPDPCVSGITYYGFEAQPFITEIGMKDKPGDRISCAVELYNPFSERINLSDFKIELTYDEPNSTGTVLTVLFGSGDIIDANSYFVVVNRWGEFDIYTGNAIQDPRLSFFGDWQSPGGRKPPIVPKPDRKPPTLTTRPVGDGIVFLRRRVVDTVGTEQWIYVDRQVVDPNWVPRKDERYFGRDVRGWHVIYQTLAEDVVSSYGTLGRRNVVDLAGFAGHNFSFYLPNPTIKPPYRTTGPQTYTKLLTVGDITRILTIGHGITPDSTIGQKLLEIGVLWETDKSEEEKVRLNLQNPLYRNIFQYLTVFDPSTDDIDNDNDGFKDANDTFSPEWKIPGRININTAPWYVIAQLPWVQDPFLNIDDPNRMRLAQAIVAYRDKLRLPVDYRRSTTIVPDPCSRQIATGIPGLREDPGFASIGELNFVTNIAGNNAYRIQRYEPDGNDLGREVIGHPGFPDLTTDGLGLGDGVVDDFEERDITFSRISNLVTVRSDVFTAYILVRIGTDGPQKRVIAILDRSDVYSGKGKVRLVALHYVPDPR